MFAKAGLDTGKHVCIAPTARCVAYHEPYMSAGLFDIGGYNDDLYQKWTRQ